MHMDARILACNSHVYGSPSLNRGALSAGYMSGWGRTGLCTMSNHYCLSRLPHRCTRVLGPIKSQRSLIEEHTSLDETYRPRIQSHVFRPHKNRQRSAKKYQTWTHGVSNNINSTFWPIFAAILHEMLRYINATFDGLKAPPMPSGTIGPRWSSQVEKQLTITSWNERHYHKKCILATAECAPKKAPALFLTREWQCFSRFCCNQMSMALQVY